MTDTARESPAGWLRSVTDLLKETTGEWLEDGIPARGAALSYYVLLSLGPFLVLVVGILEFFLTEEEVREGVLLALRTNVGPRAAETVGTVLGELRVPDLFSPGSIFALGLLLFGATAAFTNVSGSLDAIWGVEREEQTKREIALDVLRARYRGFLMMLLTGFALTVSFVLTSIAEVMSQRLEAWLPEGWVLVQLADAGLSLLFIGLLFAAVYRTLPSVRVEWSTVWVGAFITALLFVIGKWLVARLLARASWTSYYGPGASVVAFLAWIYFSSQIFFFGAEFTQVWSRRRGGVMSERD
jgi:membrane protein